MTQATLKQQQKITPVNPKLNGSKNQLQEKSRTYADQDIACISDMEANKFTNVPLPLDISGKRIKFDGREGAKDKAEWYIASRSEEGLLVVTYNSFHDTLNKEENYVFTSGLSNHLNEVERKEQRDRVAENLAKRKQEADAKERKRQEKAVRDRNRFEKASVVGESPYLLRKKVQAYGVRFEIKNEETIILIPMRDDEGEIQCLEEIYPLKRLIGNNPKLRDKNYTNATKGLFHILGKLEGASQIFVAEGYATGASVFEATGIPTVIAFDSENLDDVTAILKEKYPNHLITIASDDDRENPKNTGKTKAEQVAKMYNCNVILPSFPPDFKLPEAKVPKDFNDLHVHFGLKEVKKQLVVQPQEEQEEQKKQESAFKFVSLADMLSAPPKSRWIVKDYLDEGSLSCIFGEPGSMKSFLCLDLGLCVASGRDWHGNRLRKTGPVFYIAGEGHGGLKRRLRAWTLHHDHPEDIPFFISEAPAQILDEDHYKTVVTAFDELKKEHGDPILVIIDTLNRNFGPGDENSTGDMTKFISHIDTFMRSVGCAVMIVHHSPLGSKERARGSSALCAALDWEFSLTKKDVEREFACTKCKDYEEPQRISFKPKTIKLTGWTDEETGEELTSCILEKCAASAEEKKSTYLKGANKVAYDALCKLSNNPDQAKKIHLDEWQQAAYSAGITTSTKESTKKRTFNRAVEELRDKNLIETEDYLYWPKWEFMGLKSGTK